MAKLYIGIDPDVRLLSAAIITDDRKLKKVFLRRNKAGIGDTAIAGAARLACRLVEDVIAYLVFEKSLHQHETVLVVESQNMQHALKMRQQGKKVDFDDIKQTSQIAGCMLGAFSNLSGAILLVQPMDWKKGVPKHIHHPRIYNHIGMEFAKDGEVKSCIYPVEAIRQSICDWSSDRINMGDFADINDSIGLALYGAEKGL